MQSTLNFQYAGKSSREWNRRMCLRRRGGAKEIWDNGKIPRFSPPFISIFHPSLSLLSHTDTHKGVYVMAVTNFCIYPSWVVEGKKVSLTQSQVGSQYISLCRRAVKFTPFYSQWMWKMRAGIVVTPEELVFLDNFCAIFIYQRGKGSGNISSVTAWFKAHEFSRRKNLCSPPRKRDDWNNQLKWHGWMKSEVSNSA